MMHMTDEKRARIIAAEGLRDADGNLTINQDPPCITAQVNFTHRCYTVEVSLEVVGKVIDITEVEWLDDVKPDIELRGETGLTFDDEAGDAAVELLKEAINDAV